MTEEQLIGELEDMGVTVEWRPLQGITRGLYYQRHHLVVVRTGMTMPQRRSVLAHELGHYSLGHTCAQSRNGEALADEWAARLLIHPDEYRHAEHAYGANLYWLSFELGVSQRIVKAFQTTLAA